MVAGAGELRVGRPVPHCPGHRAGLGGGLAGVAGEDVGVFNVLYKGHMMNDSLEMINDTHGGCGCAWMYVHCWGVHK